MRYLVGDIGSYMLLKIMRCDFRYWSNVPIVASFFLRIVDKVMIDYTCCFQLRHCYQAGGGCCSSVSLSRTNYLASLSPTRTLSGSGDVVGVFTTTNNTNSTDTSDMADFINATYTAVFASPNNIPADVLLSFLSSLLLLFYLAAIAFVILIERKCISTPSFYRHWSLVRSR